MNYGPYLGGAIGGTNSCGKFVGGFVDATRSGSLVLWLLLLVLWELLLFVPFFPTPARLTPQLFDENLAALLARGCRRFSGSSCDGEDDDEFEG